jgi:hypothetical protein
VWASLRASEGQHQAVFSGLERYSLEVPLRRSERMVERFWLNHHYRGAGTQTLNRRLLRPVRLACSATPARRRRCLACSAAARPYEPQGAARKSSSRAGPPGVEPGPARLELAVLPLHHGPSRADGLDRTGLSGVALRCSSV